MGLSSVIQTALSGMNAATAWVDVTADNLANAQTPGFKATTVQFATLMPQTQSLGSGSAALSGGTNPIQVGSGVEVAATSHDFSQGSIVTSEEPALLALEGEGLFILQGSGGQRSYTRQGQFGLNSDGELVTPAGDRLLGFGVDAQGNLDRSQLRPLRVQVDSSTSAAHGGVSILRSYAVARDGHLVGNYSDGTNRTLGQLQLAVRQSGGPGGSRGKQVPGHDGLGLSDHVRSGSKRSG